MCTLTYLPTEEGFVLTSSRDERPERACLPPQKQMFGGKTYLYPIDTLSGGSWLGTSSHRTVCLLNGAFEAHQKANNYRLSRGLIMLNTLRSGMINEFDLFDIEPFTLIMLMHKDIVELHQWVWDAQKLHYALLKNTQAHIWSSATLYSTETQELRRNWFKNIRWPNTQNNADMAWHFHLSEQSNNTAHNLLMKRADGIQTISISQIKLHHQEIRLKYHDLILNKTFLQIIDG
jgi:hypothetical protein